MLQDIKVSVIIANYNNEKFIAESIESILVQSHNNLELIVVDDNSSDNSRKIIDEKKQSDNRIISLFNNINAGPSFSRNRGIKIASGKYIAILDGDDIALPKRLEVQTKFLEENPHIYLVGGSIIMIDESGDTLYRTYSETRPKILEKILTQPELKIVNTPSIINSAIMFRNTGEFLYREKMLCSEDKDLYFRMLEAGKILSNVKEEVIRCRINFNSISYTRNRELIEFGKLARLYHFQRMDTGRDDYDKLDIEKIKKEINKDIKEHGIEIDVIKNELKISMYFFRNDFLTTRNLLRKYFSDRKYSSRLNFLKFRLFYIATFFPFLIPLIKNIKEFKNNFIWKKRHFADR
jgi:glycosyltransferase involved in cell wall biosynthesis